MIEFGISNYVNRTVGDLCVEHRLFGLQKDDHSVIYDEQYVDTVPVGIGNIYSAIFNHQNKDYYAIQFTQDSVWIF